MITTFGESASKYVGTVVDGIPAGLPISEKDLTFELSFRKTGRRFVSGRRENDIPEIVSGIYGGVHYRFTNDRFGTQRGSATVTI